VPDLEERRKVVQLERDALALGIAPSVVGRTVDEAEPAVLAETADGLGALYVTEGATLGGRLLARHLADSLGLDASSGAAHFLSYGDRRGEMWRRLRAALDAFGAAYPDRIPRTVESARATFSALSHALPTPDG
jgi:heme oxygenase